MYLIEKNIKFIIVFYDSTKWAFAPSYSPIFLFFILLFDSKNQGILVIPIYR